MRALALSLAAALLAAAPARAQDGAPLYAWAQGAADGGWSVRAVFDGATAACPAGMHVRAFPDAAFPILVCEARVRAGVARVAVAGRSFRFVTDSMRSVVVLGDTGCRLRGAAAQDCDDPAAWPFPGVAARAAAEAPDYVVHTGDYFYRECPGGGCPGPSGDVWAAWEADFFRPARPLLEAAPWIMTRGNHELCARGGEGWTRLLDPAPRRAEAPLPCADFAPPYRISIPGVDLLILDTACAPERATCIQPADGRVAEYARNLRELNDLARMPRNFPLVSDLSRGDRSRWVVTHSPLWSVTPPYGADSLGTRSLQEALDAAGGLAPEVAVTMAGHVHFFEALGFVDGGHPVSFVIGHGGSSPDTANVMRPRGFPIHGAALETMTWRRGAGYVLASLDGDGWRFDVRMLAGDGLACHVHARRLTCADD